MNSFKSFLFLEPFTVVQEITACCHHEIILKCPQRHLRIGIIQARYMVPGSENNYIENIGIRSDSLTSKSGLHKANAFEKPHPTFAHNDYVA